MRFAVDECTGPKVAKWLREQGHDVFSVYDDARGSSDSEVLEIAQNETRILVSNDKDFGEKIFRDRAAHHGVILLLLHDETTASKIQVLAELLKNYADQLPDRFVVATETQVRITQPPH
jgi:predicted nuclease of predicted toxin-antitoxin system